MSKARELAELSRTVSDSADAVAITIDSSEDVTFSEDIKLGDGKKAIFGAGSDLQIYHDGSNSIINDGGTGDLEVQANRFIVQSASGNDNFLVVTPSGGVDLRHNDSGTVSTKLATTATGINVTAAASMILNESTGSWSFLRLKSPSANGGYIQFADAEDDDVGQIFYYHGSGGDYMSFTTNASEAMRILSNQRVSIGGSSSNHLLNVTSSTTPAIEFTRGSGNATIGIDNGNSIAVGGVAGDLVLRASGTTGVTKFTDSGGNITMTLTEANNVGITGQTNPTFNLDGGFVTQTWGWHLNTSYQAGFTYTTTDRSLSIFTKSADNADYIRFSTGGSQTERARITAAGILQLAGGGNDSVGEINFGNTAQNANRLQIRHQSSSWIIKTVDSEPLLFGTANSERARVLADGTLLVGKSADDNSVGFKTNTSSTYMVANTATPTFINRLGNVGDLLEFRQDSSTVGSIGTVSGSLSLGSGDCYLEMSGTANVIQPLGSVTGAASDGVIDLGSSARRFKDVFVSGGINFSANANASGMDSELLDDYEEGSWTPGLQSFNGSYSTQSGRYVKIGGSAFLWFHLDISSSHTGTDANLVVTGLPFSGITGTTAYGMTTSMHCNLWATTNKADNGIVGPGSTVLSFYKNVGQAGIYAPKLSDIGTGNFLTCLVLPVA